MGGGIGVPPILELAKQMRCEKKQIVVGYRDSQTFLKEEFEQNGEVYISTEDGSVGTKGNVMDAIREQALEADMIYACGPTQCCVQSSSMPREIILHAIFLWKSAWRAGSEHVWRASANPRKDHHTNVNNKRICKDGPVFLSTEVEL